MAFAVAFSLLPSGCARSQGLPPGHHTSPPKSWKSITASVVNFTPFQFNYRIENLTPGPNHDLWFSAGSSVEHIDAQDSMSEIPMPYSQWTIGGIAVTTTGVVFTIGQSGKVGIIDSGGSVRYVQVVPRKDFPDLRDLVVDGGGEMWFVDLGRKSIGYRAPDGRVVEHPFPDNTYPIQMRHCMGRLWVVAINPTAGTELFFIGDNLRPIPYPSVVRKPMQIEAMACDVSDRLWLSTGYGATISTLWFDRSGHHKEIGGIGNAIAPDLVGGIWAQGPQQYGWRLMLIHVAANGARRDVTLPASIPVGHDLVVDGDGTMWLAVDYGGSPVAVTRIEGLSKR